MVGTLMTGDPLLKCLRTRVVSARPAAIAEPPAAKGRAKQKKKDNIPADSSSTTPNGTGGTTTPVDKGVLWDVELEDTVIFPEGGGQPFDTGVLRVEGEQGTREYVVEGCLRKKLDSVHLVRVPPGVEGFEGIVGKEVEVTVDWVRRMDHVSGRIFPRYHRAVVFLSVSCRSEPSSSR